MKPAVTLQDPPRGFCPGFIWDPLEPGDLAEHSAEPLMNQLPNLMDEFMCVNTIGSTISMLTWNKWYKPSPYGCFIIALPTVYTI